jgi:hypothetical protein
MSITATRTIACRACATAIDDLTIESANPTRHPWFQDQVLDRTLLRRTCPSCGAPHVHLDRLVWTDLPGRLCALVLRDDERGAWQQLEPEAVQALAVPLRDEGPAFVRAWGAEVAIRVVFGLEELREKVLGRIHGLDDRLVECVKLAAVGDPAARLEAVSPNDALHLQSGAGVVTVPWPSDQQAAVLREIHPALFADTSGWINARRVA